MKSEALNRCAVIAAGDRIRPYAKKTPVVSSDDLDDRAGCRLFLKCENRQRSRSFKFRGACNALLCLSEDERQRGVITVSSGNHGAALSLAGRLLDISVWVVSQRTASAIKVENMEANGARIFFTEPGMEPREQKLKKLVAETGRRVIHPYNNERIIAGQGTAALELIEEAPDLDAVITPVGGGGLLSGTILAAQDLAVYGAEPSGADDAFRSLKIGAIQPSVNPETVCDGLLTSLGSLTFPILQQGVEEIFRVDDVDTLKARQAIRQQTGMVVEPSSAITLAAVWRNKKPFAGKKVGLILSGGNVISDSGDSHVLQK